MSEKDKKRKLENLFFKVIGSLIASILVSLFLGAIIASYIEFGSLKASNLGNAFNTTTFMTSFPICILVCLLVVLLFFTTSPSNNKKEMKGKDDLENQRFMNKDELNKKLKVYYFDELYKVNLDGWPVYSRMVGNRLKIHFGPNYHMLVIGSTGSGKTVTYVEPSIQILSELKSKPSFFITDTKGELFAHHSKKLQENGYNIIILDLINPYRSTCWNPLESVYKNYQKSKHMKEDILVHEDDDVNRYNFIKVGDINKERWFEFQGKAFATLEEALNEANVESSKLEDQCFADLNDIASALCPIEDKKDPGWEQGGKNYILAILLAMLEDSANPDLDMTLEKFNFYNMYKLAMNKENDFETMEMYFSGRGELSKTKELTTHILGSKAKNTRDSYMSILSNKLSMFSDNGINYMTSKNEIDFYEFDERPTAIFAKIPDENRSRYSLASICIAQAYKEFARKARNNETTTGEASLKRPLYYIMDEFANLPPISDISNITTVSRSRRIYLLFAIQAYSQLENVYGKEIAATIRANCNGEIYIGTPDLQTREEFSKKLGNYTIQVDSKSSSKDGQKKDNIQISTQYQSRPLIYASDLAHIEHGHFYAYIYPLYPIDSFMESYYTKAREVFTYGKIDEPFIPGRILKEEKVYYDPKIRNNKVLGI